METELKYFNLQPVAAEGEGYRGKSPPTLQKVGQSPSKLSFATCKSGILDHNAKNFSSHEKKQNHTHLTYEPLTSTCNVRAR